MKSKGESALKNSSTLVSFISLTNCSYSIGNVYYGAKNDE